MGLPLIWKYNKLYFYFYITNGKSDNNQARIATKIDFKIPIS